MAYITQRAFVYIPKKAIKLAGEEWTRALGIYNGWSRLRFGFLCAITPDGVANISTAGFTAGLCSSGGTGSGTMSANAIGASFTGSITASSAKLLTYNAGANYPYYSCTAMSYFSRNSKGIGDEATVTPTQAFAPAGLGYRKRRTPIILDFTRQAGGGGLLTLSVFSTNNTAAQYAEDFRPDHLMDGVDQITTPTINSQTLTVQISAVTIGAGDWNGGLDTLFIYWSRTQFPLEIYAVCATATYPLNYSSGPGTLGAGGAVDYVGDYSNGSATSTTMVQGFGWAGSTVFNGTTNPAGSIGYAGTSMGYPWDPFESYSVGTIGGGGSVILNAGSGWAGNGVIN